MDKQLTRVMKAALSGFCNTTRDIADETGIPVEIVSGYVSQLVQDGVLRRTGRSVPNARSDGGGPRYLVFEPTRTHDE